MPVANGQRYFIVRLKSYYSMKKPYNWKRYRSRNIPDGLLFSNVCVVLGISVRERMLVVFHMKFAHSHIISRAYSITDTGNAWGYLPFGCSNLYEA